MQGDVQKRCKELLIQVCDAEDVQILKGVVSKDHIHMHVEYAPRLSISNLVKRLKGRGSRLLQSEYPFLKKHFWAIGYGAWLTGTVTDEMIQEYLEHHRPPNGRTGNMILE